MYKCIKEKIFEYITKKFGGSQSVDNSILSKHDDDEEYYLVIDIDNTKKNVFVLNYQDDFIKLIKHMAVLIGSHINMILKIKISNFTDIDHYHTTIGIFCV